MNRTDMRCSTSLFRSYSDSVTVLFADLKGSMELLADRDPEGGQAPPSPSSCLPLLAPSEVGLEDLLMLAPIGLARPPTTSVDV